MLVLFLGWRSFWIRFDVYLEVESLRWRWESGVSKNTMEGKVSNYIQHSISLISAHVTPQNGTLQNQK
jgi:hypothetical protein